MSDQDYNKDDFLKHTDFLAWRVKNAKKAHKKQRVHDILDSRPRLRSHQEH